MAEVDYRECTECGPPGHVGLTMVAQLQGISATLCRKCGKETLLPKEAPKEVVDDLVARGFIPKPVRAARADRSTLGELPDWFDKHVEDKGGVNAELFAWILTRPEAVQKVLVEFPPGCVVRVKDTREFGVQFGVVAGDSEFPTIKVVSRPGAKETAREYMPVDLEVVDFWNGVTPEVVLSILDTKNVQAVVSTQKTGRNEPCPCGSGLKAKRCKCRDPRKGLN